MDPLFWIGVGLGVGLLAPLVGGEGFGLFGDLLFGTLGAFIGGWIADPLTASPSDALLAALLGGLVFVAGLRLTQPAHPRAT